LTFCQLAAGIVLYLSYTFDATDGGDWGEPDACAHVGFRPIDAKGFDFDQHFALRWNGRGDVSKNQLFGTPELVDDHRLHC
jgi:hypothetical protein